MQQLDLFTPPGSKKPLLQEEAPQKPTDNTELSKEFTKNDSIVFVDEEKDILIPNIQKNINNSPRGRKAIQQEKDDIINVPEDEILFQKQYYSISEVANMFNVNTSLIRFWENEFDILQPRKNRKGDRFFSPTEIKKIELIHHLLRKQKFTIPGAKEYLKNNKKAEQQHSLVQSLQQIKSFLLELKATIQ